jgi:DNA polymerase I
VGNRKQLSGSRHQSRGVRSTKNSDCRESRQRGPREQDLAVHPGQDIKYIVVDDEKSSRERVALAHEEIESYDASYYETQLVRAVESVLAPLGWDRTEIQQELAGTREPELTDF